MEYIAGDPNITRFIYLVLSFVASMGALIFRPNFVRILLGWDGLGLTSYALVIYYQREKSAAAGILTALSNRIGDAAILCGVGYMYYLGGFNFIFYTEHGIRDGVVVLAALAAITKRAQLPFSAWLPAAIAAPTPVSALVHSSTLVTAGVYLMVRFRPTLANSGADKYLLWVGALTILMAGLRANFEFDLKKVIALSTLRQLGLIIRTVGVGLPGVAFFHLLAHALFKALLFICAGLVIHSVGDTQDIRAMGGVLAPIPVVGCLMAVANLALCGAPFLTGFYSKDLILELFILGQVSPLILVVYRAATGFTVSYTWRLTHLRFGGVCHLLPSHSCGEGVGIGPRSLALLGVGAVVGGCALS